MRSLTKLSASAILLFFTFATPNVIGISCAFLFYCMFFVSRVAKGSEKRKHLFTEGLFDVI